MLDKGIYVIKNVQTEDVYVGSSTRIKARWKDHRSALNRNVHHCKALQDAWNVFGEHSFEHSILEYTNDLELVEAAYIKAYREEGRAYNTSDVAHNPMRSQESIDKMLATRGDSQKGAAAPSAKLPREEYLQILVALAETTYSAEDLSDYFGLSARSIRDIQKGIKHDWIQEEFPKAFNTMYNWRENLRSYRAEGIQPPSIDVGISKDFISQLSSHRRDYVKKSEAEATLRRLELENISQGFDNKRKKEIEKLQRQVKAEQKVWLELAHTDGRELTLERPEDCDLHDLSFHYVSLLKAKKLIRYKGWRLKK